MKILIVNDDGIKSLGLKILVEQLSPLGEIYICAPEEHQSGKSQALTLGKAFKVKNYKTLYNSQQAYSVMGTPADCIRMAFSLFTDIEFDLVVSGINQGANLGVDVLHSGTVGAASEALSLGIPAIAISSPYQNYKLAIKHTYNLVKYLLDNKIISYDYLLNINFPSSAFNQAFGIKFAVQGYHTHLPIFTQVKKNLYKAGYAVKKIEEKENSDVFYYKNGIISITPIFEDRSRADVVQRLNAETELKDVLICDKIKE